MKEMSISALTKIAKELDIAGATRPESARAKYASVRRLNSAAEASPPRAYPYPGRSTRYIVGPDPRWTR